MYPLLNISWEEYKKNTDWKNKPVSHVDMVRLLLDIDEHLQKSEDGLFIWDCNFKKFEREFRKCISDGVCQSHENQIPFTLQKTSDFVVRMTVKYDEEYTESYEIMVHHSVLDDMSVTTEVLQDIYIQKLEKTFKLMSKELTNVRLKNKHVKEFFRSIWR